MPVNSRYHADPRHPSLGGAFFDPVRPADFPKAILRFRNDPWAARVGLDDLGEAEWIAHCARFAALPGNIPQPLALRYHGHQFHSYNPDLGDGRGFLFAQMRDAQDGRLLDLATKGSGQTPWSRSGDGRLTLKGGVREILATEYLEALGVYTSKSFSLIETGEHLMRGDEPSPTRSAVLVRLGHSHVRFGTFQRLAYLGETENLKKLVDYSIATYWPEAAEASDPVAAFFTLVARACAEMVAEWMTAGFVHGVLNTDNTVITGESFDYGPWRFLPVLNPQFTAAYFDETGLYAFGRQPSAILWNLQRLAECLVHLSTQDAMRDGLRAYASRYEQALTRRVMARLGLSLRHDASDFELATRFLIRLETSRLPFEQVFFDCAGMQMERLKRSPLASHYQGEEWQALITALLARDRAKEVDSALSHPYFARKQPVTMLIEEVEALWAPIAEDDDWSPFQQKITDIRQMAEAYRELLIPRGKIQL